jgi:hypothetical protein
MIFHIEPVAHILSLAIDRQGFVVADIVDKQGDQLLGELIGSVVVGAVGDHDGQVAGIVISSDEMIVRCL